VISADDACEVVSPQVSNNEVGVRACTVSHKCVPLKTSSHVNEIKGSKAGMHSGIVEPISGHWSHSCHDLLA
jgi:hypothetical protein